MKIMLASRNFFPFGVVGGAQASMLLLAKALERRGNDVAILSVDATANRGIHHETQLSEYRLKLRNVYTQKSTSRIAKVAWHISDRYSQLMRKKYEEAIRDFNPDVINTNVMAGLGVGFWEAAAACSVPVVHTVHDYYLLCMKSDMYRRKINCQVPCLACRAIACSTSRRASEHIREVIYVSTHMRDVHERGQIFTKSACSTIIAGSYAATAGRYMRDAAKITLGFLGRLSPEKGVDKIINSLRVLSPIGWKMVIGGTGSADYVSYLKGLSDGLPVTFTGFVTPSEFYSQVDAVIIGSLWHEPAARVTYEAGLQGVVPIVTNRGGLPELVGYGARGFIYEPDETGSLEGQLLEILNHPGLLTEKRAAWVGAELEFSPDAVAVATEAVFLRAIARGAERP